MRIAAESAKFAESFVKLGIVPGDHFGMPGFLRFGFGDDLQHFQEALAETERGLRRLFSD